MHKTPILLIAFVLFIFSCKKENVANKTPQIIPVQGTIKVDWGDTITLAGKNLPSDAKVFFNTNQADVVSNNGSQIRCVVPVSFDNQVTSSVYIKYADQTITLNNYVTLNAPVVTSFTSTQAIGDTVIINGDHFNDFKLQVNFGSATTTAFRVSKNVLKAVVPNEIKSVHDTIKVTSQLQTVNASPVFEVLKPVITSVTPGDGLIGDKISINGKYFHPGAPFAIYLDGAITSDAVESNSVISFNLPYKAYPRRKTTVTLKLLEYEITYPVDINIKDNWVLVSEDVPFVVNNTTPLTVGTDIYVVAAAKSADPSTFYLWHFNQSDFSWAKVGNQSIAIHASYCTGTNGSKIYLYDSGSSTTFNEWDPATGNWTAKAGLPGLPRIDPAMFSISGKLYLGAGQQVVNNAFQASNDWYVYTPGTDSWSRIADMTAANGPAMLNAQTVVVSNIAYVLLGGWFYNYKYDPSTNTWSPLPDMLDYARIQAGVVPYQNKIYTLKGTIVSPGGNPNRSVYDYDIASGQWEFDAGHIDIYDEETTIAFISNGKIYMLAYNTFDTHERLYEAIKLPFY
ncbi:MAG TPA: IPT/TIG domain-containing protein [Mucilaginibacter sp.]|jgi:hypothetical protein|nr:IPT/TIG domain-containing protein [Mucilaginibacter sp.]